MTSIGTNRNGTEPERNLSEFMGVQGENKRNGTEPPPLGGVPWFRCSERRFFPQCHSLSGTTKMRTTCKQCSSIRLSVGRTHIASGAEVFPLYCLDCGETQTQYIKKELALAHEARNGELKYVKTKTAQKYKIPKCEVCGKDGAELHHWAPQYLFLDADNWPKSYLCREHHQIWHKLVTPNMSA